MASTYTSAGVLREGFDYQDLLAVELLIDYLAHPSKFQFLEFEAPEAGSLDDIVAVCSDGTSIYRQVKFTVDSEHEIDWDWLIEAGTGKRSLLKKWHETLQDLQTRNVIVKEASLYTNRKPSPDFNSALTDGVIDFGKIQNEDLRKKIVIELGSVKNVKAFFAKFRFKHTQPYPDALEAKLQQQLADLRNGDTNGWFELCKAAREWAKYKDKPTPDGKITIHHVRRAALWKELKELPQNFEVPVDYILPSQEFHESVKYFIEESAERYLIIWGKPGVGKSTYLSYLTNLLREEQYPVIRHHYFLSTADRSQRFDFQIVLESLMQQISAHYSEFLGNSTGIEPIASNFNQWISAVSSHFANEGKNLVIIVDGLDHVWRERDSINELQLLFERLFPAIDNVKFIIGTQKLDRGTYPSAFRNFIPPEENWMEVPLLDLNAVTAWTELNKTALDIPDVEQGSYYLKSIAEAFYQISEGHPLHLKYSLRTLQEQLKAVTESNILSLPKTQHGDIRNYYQRLWDSLDNHAAVILHLLVSSEVPLREEHIIDCLHTNSVSLADVNKGLSSVAHLLDKGLLGLTPVHNSLTVFVQHVDGHETQANQLLPSVTKWLETKAPTYWQWAYKWTTQIRSKVTEPILDGVTENWLYQSIINGNPLDEIERIIRAAKDTAIENDQFGKFTYFSILETYVTNLESFQSDGIDQIFECALRLNSDRDLIAVTLNQLSELPVTRLAKFAEYANETKNEKIIDACFDEFVGRARKHIDHEEKYYGNLGSWIDINIYLALFLKDFDFKRIIDFFEDNPDSLSFRKVVHWLCKNKQVGHLKSLAESKIAESFADYIALGLFKIALEEEIDLKHWNLKEALYNSPYLAAYALIKNGVSSSITVTLPIIPQILVKRQDIEASGPQPELVDYFHRYFFYELVRTLQGRTELISLSTIHNEWVKIFLNTLSSLALEISNAIRQAKPIEIGAIYRFFYSIQRPQWDQDKHGNRYASYATQALMLISNDCLLINSHFKYPLTITTGDVEALYGSKFFQPEQWLENYIENGRLFLQKDAYAFLHDKESQRYKSAVYYLNEKTLDHGRIARLCLLHGDKLHADESLRLSAQCLVGYIWRKDISLAELMDALMLCHQHQVPNTWELLKQIIPLIDKIDDFTDGKETRHLPAELAEHIWVIKPALFSSYYRYLIDNEEFHRADNTFGTFLERCDLTNPVNKAIAKTAVTADEANIFKDRVDKGNQDASEIYIAVQSFLGNATVREKGSANTDPTREKEFSFDYSLYPPNKIEEMLKAAREAHYWPSDIIKPWFEFWSKNSDPVTLIDQIDDYLFRVGERHLDELYDEIYNLCKQVKGKAEAYTWLVRAHKARSGWSSYLYSTSEASKRWQIIQQDYPDKWHDFLKQTCVSSSAKPSYYLGYVRLIEYLLLFKQQAIVTDIIKQAVDATVNRTSGLVLDVPAWVDSELPNIDILFSRLLWPSCLTKERAAYQICELLKHPATKKEAEKALIECLKLTTLESVTIALSTILARLKSEGEDVNSLIEKFAQNIRKPSLVTEQLLRELIDGYIPTSDFSAFHSFHVPKDFEESDYFHKYITSHIPPWLSMIADRFQDNDGLPFKRHWAYEWQCITDANKIATSGPPWFFISNRSDGESIVFDTMQSEAYKSAFLRTLAYFVDNRRLRLNKALLFAIDVFPIDILKWRVEPSAKPDIWPKAEKKDQVDLIPQQIWSGVEKMWQTQTRLSGEECRIVTASGIVYASELAIYSLSIMGCFQKFSGGDIPELEEFSKKLEWLNAHPTEFGILPYQHYDVLGDDLEPIDAGGWSIMPASYRLRSGVIPRWTYYREYYGTYVPAPYLVNTPIILRPNKSDLEFISNELVIGRWKTWNDNLQEKDYRETSYGSGQMLSYKASILDKFTKTNKANFCWIAAINAHVRENSYSEFREAKFYKCFGGTNLIQA